MAGQDDRDRNWLRTAAKVGMLGTDLVIFAGLGFWIGQAVDEHFGWRPWATFVGLLIGFMVGFWSICRRVSDWR
jgi:F0F1-type ATP synthase assembly protein I